MVKRRQVASSSRPNPPGYTQSKATSLLDQIGGFVALMTELPEIARQADQQRLSVLVDGFERDYPEVYESILELVELSAEDARDQLIQKWPRLGLIKLYPNHLQLITMVQGEIKARKKRLNP